MSILYGIQFKDLGITHETSVGVLTILTPSLALYHVHVQSMTSLGAVFQVPWRLTYIPQKCLPRPGWGEACFGLCQR